MPVVPFNALIDKVARLYARQNRTLAEDTYQWLKQQPRLHSQIELWLNEELKKIVQQATKKAIYGRMTKVPVAMIVETVAQNAHSKLTPQSKLAIPKERLRLAMVFLLEDAGYVVTNGMVSFDLDFEPEGEDDVNVEVASGSEEAPKPAAALEMKAPTSKPVELELDLDDKNEQATDPGAAPEAPPKNGLEVGQVWTNNRGMQRKIDSITDDSVAYTVVESNVPEVKQGDKKFTKKKSFEDWAQRQIG